MDSKHLLDLPHVHCEVGFFFSGSVTNNYIERSYYINIKCFLINIISLFPAQFHPKLFDFKAEKCYLETSALHCGYMCMYVSIDWK